MILYIAENSNSTIVKKTLIVVVFTGCCNLCFEKKSCLLLQRTNHNLHQIWQDGKHHFESWCIHTPRSIYSNYRTVTFIGSSSGRKFENYAGTILSCTTVFIFVSLHWTVFWSSSVWQWQYSQRHMPHFRCVFSSLLHSAW